MVLHILSFIFFIFFTNGASGATVMVVNMCGFTVWPGISGNPDINITGFELEEGNSRFFKTPEKWEGQIWGRIGCNFNGSSHGACITGDCGSGEMECNGRNYTPPVTIAGFSLSPFENFYDVSFLKGYNVQMMVGANGLSGECNKKGCTQDLNRDCLSELKLEGGEGCKSPCQAYPSREYCCNISSTESISCKETAYTRWFKSACPRSSVTISDFETNREYNYSCNADEYVVAFCPPAYYFSSIKTGLLLQNTDQLISISGTFTLGFFYIEDYLYLGIWYTNDVEFRKVWVANPNTKIETYYGDLALSIDPNNGNMIITAGGTNLMNVTDVQAGPNPNVTATLEDNGNFRLINENDKSVLWQSFDHPTNVLLPGMKLGSNMTSGQNWTLSSWLSDDILDSGAFTLSWEPIDEDNQRLMIRRRGQPYWTSGFLDVKTFEYMFLLDDDRRSKYVLSPVYNSNEQYLSYIHNPGYEGTPDTFPMWILTPNGQITNYNTDVWTPELCYGYNSSNGCMDSSLPHCRREDDYFSYRNGEFSSHETRNSTDNNLSLSISDCFVTGWNDCRCVGYNSSSTNGTGCIFWRGNNNNFLVNSGDNSTSKYVISSQNPINISTKKNMKQIWTLTGITVTLVFLCLGLVRYMKKRKQKRKEYRRQKRDEYFLELTASESFKDVHQLESNSGNGNNVLLFSFASIMAATGDFSVENKLGQGGFGPVYKGRLSDGREIAIKRFSKTSGQGLVEFKNELILIAKLQHTNLVRVLGCCIHREEKMLIYEYMPNKSLDFILFDENKKAELDWPKRFNIIEGIAQGLLYLHKYSRMRVIHQDLKSNNILLDPQDFRFRFGVLILEIVTGRRNSSFIYLDRTFNLLGYAWELWQQGKAMDLEDPTLGNTCVVQQFLRTVQVALLCVQESATDRPTTSDMISMLLNDTISLPTPNKPAFFTGRVESKSTSDDIKQENCSANSMTITTMEGR